MIRIKVTENVFSSNSCINVPLNSVATLSEREKKMNDIKFGYVQVLEAREMCNWTWIALKTQ